MSDAGTLALVESPAQLLNVVELAHSGQVPGSLRVAVLAPSAGRGREQLRAVVALAREDGLDVSWHEPRQGGASVARTVRSLLSELGRTRRLVVGDPFSGVLQVLIGLVRPTEVTIVDDGTATLEFVRQWAVGEALHRWHQPVLDPRSSAAGVAGAARHHVAATLRRRLSPEQGTSLRLFTCMPLASAGFETVGVDVVPNTYAWLRGRWSAPEVRDGVDLVGTSLAESGVVETEAYVAGVERLVADHRVTRYVAHRREAEAKLDRVRALGVEVVTPGLPLEVEARRGPVNGTLISFPSTVVHTLPVVLSDTTARTYVCDIPEGWYASGTDAAAEHFLRRVTTSAQSSHGLPAVVAV